MTDTGKTGGGKPRPEEDPWERLARTNRGEDLTDVILGDTGKHLRDDNTNAMELAGSASTEILELVTQSLAAEPERADLWMMRFDVQKSLGLKREFADAMGRGFQNPRVRSRLDWDLIRGMWADLAPGEALPDGVELVDRSAATAARVAPVAVKTAPGTAHDRRFADIANRIASRELAVLSKAWGALQARPNFLEDFARKVAPLLKRPTPLAPSESLTVAAANPHVRILLKREDQRSITPEQENAAAQCYVAALLGRPTVITGSDVDAHALALAELAPRFSLKCVIVVRPDDLVRKRDFIDRLRATGAQVESMADSGTLGNDPREGAVRLWLKSMGYAHLALSLGTGPAPYPSMINNFRSLLGREVDLQLRAQASGRARTLVASVGSEADSIGYLLPQLNRGEVELMLAEPEPGGVDSWRPSARLRAYNGAIREHAWLRSLGRVDYVAIPDSQAIAMQERMARDSLRLSLEDSRSIALVMLLTRRDRSPRDYVVLVA